MNTLRIISRLFGVAVLTSFAFAFSVVAEEDSNASKNDDSLLPKKVVNTSEDDAKPKEIGAIVREIEVRFAGPKTTNESVVLANLRTKVGEPFTQTQSEDDIRAVYATGLFQNVRIIQEPATDGIKIVVLVQGKPKLKDIVFEGNQKFKAEKLKKQIKSKVGEVVSEKQIADDANTLVEYYQKSGYHKIKIGFDVMPDELTGQSIIKFKIDEGERVKIARVNFVGNKAYTTKILRSKLETRNWNWLTWLTKKGYLKDTVLEEDKDKLADFYRESGYIDVEVREVKCDLINKDEMVVTFFVEEGNQYKVGSFQVDGYQLFTREEIDKKLPMKAGSLFTPGGLQKDIKAIKDMYGARGYIDANIKPTRVPNVNTGSMDISLEIREGDMAYLELVEVRGNIKTKDKVIRRELPVKPGEVYNSVKIDAAKQRLENLGYFSKVSAVPEDTDVPNRKNLVIAVEEQRTGSISFGAGFSSVDSITGFVEVSQGNFDIMNPPYFTGAGQKARVRAQYGARRQDYIVSFTEPWFMNERIAVGGDLFFNEASYLSSIYNERRYGADLRTSKALGEFNRADLVYKFEEIELFNFADTASQTLMDEKGNRTKSSLNLSLTRDTRDNFNLPTSGYKTELWSEVAGGPALMGQTDIYKFGFNGQVYFLMPWWEKNILSFNGGTGIVDKWSDGNRVPIFDRYFLGGPSSVRGFKNRDVGPKDASADNEPIGGKTMAFIQTEYSVPVIDHVRFATFVDAGQVWSDSFEWGTTSPAVGAGIGLRLFLPITGMAPINLDYGWPIRHDQSTDTGGRFDFSMGTKF